MPRYALQVVAATFAAAPAAPRIKKRAPVRAPATITTK